MSIEQRGHDRTPSTRLLSWSRDNGRTWTDPVRRSTGEKHPGGMLRVTHAAGMSMPAPEGSSRSGLRGFFPAMTLSKACGSGTSRMPLSRRMVVEPEERSTRSFTREENSMRSIRCPESCTGKNAVMIGDNPSRPMKLPEWLHSSTGADLSARGRWTARQPRRWLHLHRRRYPAWAMEKYKLVWNSSERIIGDPERSTRGMDEPTNTPRFKMAGYCQ